MTRDMTDEESEMCTIKNEAKSGRMSARKEGLRNGWPV